MKNVLLVAFATVAMLFSTQVKISAQVELGVKGGLNTSNTSSNDKSREGESILGFNAGIFVDIPLNNILPNLYLQPGFSIVEKSIGKMSDNWDETRSTLYLEMPILMSYRYPLSEKLKVYADFGPYFSYALFQGGQGMTGEELNNSSFDAGIVLGAGLKFKRFSFGLQYDLGLVNIFDGYSEYSDISGINMKTRALSMNVAYTIPNEFYRSVGRAISNANTKKEEGVKKNQIGMYAGIPLQKGVSSMSLGLRNTYNFSNNIGWIVDLGGTLTSWQQSDGEYKNYFGIQGATGIKATSNPVLGELGMYVAPQIGYSYSFEAESGNEFYVLEAGLDAKHKFNVGVCYGIKGGSWGLSLGYNF